MRYTVVWTPGAERHLADLWLDASDRRAVTDAAHRIDQRLARDPEDAGESRPDGRRVLFEPPLGAIFRVRPDDRIVTVVAVWRFATLQA